jgi:hypothetical protein
MPKASGGLLRGEQRISANTLRFSWQILLAGMLALVLWPAPAPAATPLNLTLQPGDTLFLRFQLQVPLPNPFNTVTTTIYYDTPRINYGHAGAIYDDSDLVMASWSGSNTQNQALGVAYYFSDVSMGGPLPPSGGYIPSSLASYLDGNGMISYTWQGSTSVTIPQASVGFGYMNPGGGGAYLTGVQITAGVNTSPPPLPEPGAGFLVVGMMVLIGRVRARRA